MKWSCDQCRIFDLEVPDGQPVRCKHTPKSTYQPTRVRPRRCIFQSAAPVAQMECGCGSVYRCNLIGKLCSYSKPIDQFVYAGDVQLDAQNFIHCAACNHEQLPFDLGHVEFQRDPAKINIGYLPASYLKAGGTETWGRTVLPRLTRVHLSGMVVTDFLTGDFSMLGCPADMNREKVPGLAAASDIIVSWGVPGVAELMVPHSPKLVLVHHGDLNNEWLKTFIESQSGYAAATVFINEEAAAYAKTVLPCRVEYIPNAVDPVRIIPTQALAKEKPTVLWCARFSVEKRAQLAVEAARLMPDYQFILLGEGHDQPRNVPANVTMPGLVASPGDWLAVADCFLSTADMEGFGLSMAEAMLAGVPVVATPVGLGARRDLVQSIGLNPSPAEIADAIRAADNAGRTAAAKSFVEDHHAVDRIVAQWEDLLLSL